MSLAGRRIGEFAHRLFPGHCPGLRDAPEIVPLVPSDPIVEGPASADSGEKREPVRTHL